MEVEESRASRSVCVRENAHVNYLASRDNMRLPNSGASQRSLCGKHFAHWLRTIANTPQLHLACIMSLFTTAHHNSILNRFITLANA